MARHRELHAQIRVDEVAEISEQDPEWDAVAQASWESFPASDPSGWINTPSRSDQPFARQKSS